MESLFSHLLNGIGENVTTAIIAASLNRLFSYIVERKFHKNRLVVMALTLSTALVASVFSFAFLTKPANHLPWTIVVIFLTSVTLWALFFHVSAINYGHRISGIKLGSWSALSANWVKSIDYIYLKLSTLSVLRIVVSAVTVGNGATYLNAVASVLLGFAVALRITRTSIEVSGWDKSRPAALEAS